SWHDPNFSCTGAYDGGVDMRKSVHCREIGPGQSTGRVGDPIDAWIGIFAPLFPFRYRALWIRLDECDALPVLHRRDCKSDGQRALAASAFLRDQSNDVQNWALPDAAA